MAENLSDAALVELLREGDEPSFTVIYELYFELLYRHACRVLGEDELARDAVHDVFSTLWEKREQLQIGSLSAYLYASTRNAVLKQIRRARIYEPYVDEILEVAAQTTGAADTEARVVEKDLREIIDAEIDRLPERMRIVFRLSRDRQLTHKEIAEELGVSERTVKNQITSSLAILRRKLGHLFFYLC